MKLLDVRTHLRNKNGFMLLAGSISLPNNVPQEGTP